MIELPGNAFVYINGVLDFTDYGFITYYVTKALSNIDKCKSVKLNLRSDINYFKEDEDISNALNNTSEEFNVYITIGKMTDLQIYIKREQDEFNQIIITDNAKTGDIIINNVDAVISNNASSLSKAYKGARFKLPCVALNQETEIPDNDMLKDRRTKIMLCSSNRFWKHTLETIYKSFDYKDPVLVCILNDTCENIELNPDRPTPQTLILNTRSYINFERVLNAMDVVVDTAPDYVNNIVLQTASVKGKEIITVNKVKQYSSDTIVDTLQKTTVPGWLFDTADNCYIYSDEDLERLLSIIQPKAPDNYPDTSNGLINIHELMNKIIGKIFKE